MRMLFVSTAVSLMLASPAVAGDADVIAVRTRQSAPRVFDFDVTVRSKDTGWDRYADMMQAVAPDGTVLGTRVLDHPHDDEQPFTRDLYGIRVPAGVAEITIRARFKPSGFNGEVYKFVLPK